jgi:hypothetical protein
LASPYITSRLYACDCLTYNYRTIVYSPSMASSYPPPNSLPAYSSVHPRTLLPLLPPPQEALLRYPFLPTPPHQPSESFLESFRLSRHTLPAAYPRSHPYIPLPSPLPKQLDGIERRDHAKQRMSQLLKVKESYVNGQLSHLPNSNKMHWMVVNRYVRSTQHSDHTTPVEGVTLFLAQATGFPKEACLYL